MASNVLILLSFLWISTMEVVVVVSSSAQIYHNRRILHQPFFPLASLSPASQPPSPSPQPQPQQQQPKYPFSSQSPPETPDPFFPFYPSPPPPPSTSLATFPANISSLILPQSSPSKPLSRKLIAVAIAISLVSVALIVFAASAFVLYHRRKPNFAGKSPARTDSLRLFPPNTAASDEDQKPPSSVLNPSVAEQDDPVTDSSNAGTSSSSVTGYQKLGSPELHPLPPLPRYHHSRQNHRNEDGEEDEDEFFSPRGSTGSPRGLAPAAFRRGLQGEDGSFFCKNMHSRSVASSASSNSASPTLSVLSSTPSMPLSSSPRSLRSKSPDSVIAFPPPCRPPPPVPVTVPVQSMAQFTPKLNAIYPSEGNSGDTHNSPGRISDVSELNHPSPARNTPVLGHYYTAVKLQPPPPPPPPPPRFWESPVVMRMNRESMTGPPELITPSRPVGFQNSGQVSSPESLETMEKREETPKLKLKPLHWDKVRASSDRAMVWDQLKSSSFQLNEEMIETLFMVNTASLTSKDGVRRPILTSPNQENMVLDPKKSQNIAILLRALNVTIDEVCEALLEGNGDTLGTELLESLLKMAPTKEEERKLKEFNEESPIKLGPAEKFLKAVVDIPFAFKRVDAMLYIANFDAEVDYLERSFETLEAACEELRKSRMFMKLLEAVLKAGNRMNIGTNRGDAQAFKLDTLLKLVDIKGTDGKTSLLHFVVQEIIRAEGSRLSGANQNLTSEENQQSALLDDVEFRKLGLQVVSSLSGELTNVKKAAAMDSDVLTCEVAKLAGGVIKIGDVLKLKEEFALKIEGEKFLESMNGFLKKAEEEILKIQGQESVVLSLVKEITEYFHGDSAKEEAHPFRIFMVVRDFLCILDQVCKEVGKVNERSTVSSAREFPLPENPSLLPLVFPGFNMRRHSSSSDDSSSPSP